MVDSKKERNAYVAITDPEWFHFHANHDHTSAVFWRQATEPLKIEIGASFFMLVRGARPRFIRSFGYLSERGALKVTELWDRFGKATGTRDLEKLVAQIGKRQTETIGWYLIEHIEYFNPGLQLDEDEAKITQRTTSGRYIDVPLANKLVANLRSSSR